MNGRGSSRDNGGEDKSKRKKLLAYVSGGGGGGRGGSGGSGGNDPPPVEDRKPPKDRSRLSKSKGEREVERATQQEIQDLIIEEIGKVRKHLPDGVFDDAQLHVLSHLQKDYEGTKTLVYSIFRNFLEQIRKNTNQEQAISLNRHETDTLVDVGDNGSSRTYLRNVDDITSKELESMNREMEQLRGDNAQLSADWHDALDRIAKMESKHSQAVKEAVDYERKMEQNKRVGLKTQIEAAVRKDFNNQIQQLQGLVNLERQNVVTEKSGRAADHREYKSSQEKLLQIHEREMNDLENKHVKSWERRQLEYQKKLAEEKRPLEEQILQLEAERTTVLAEANYQFELEREQWDQTRSKMINKHLKEKDELQERLEAELHSETAKSIKEKKELNDTMDDLVTKHDEKIERLTARHSTERKQLENQIEEKKQALDNERAQLLSEVAETEANLKREAEEAEAQMKKKYDKMFAEVGERHEKEKEQLRKDRDAYSAALLDRDKVRDKIEFLSDVQVTSKFHKLVKEVEELARLEWKRDPDIEALVKSLSVQPTTLMRQILQDTIWVVLHEFIFCSPFRIFGEEGKRLQAEWVEQCGEGASVHLSVNQHSRSCALVPSVFAIGITLSPDN